MANNPSITALARPVVELLDQFAQRADVCAALRQAQAGARERLQRQPELTEASVAVDLSSLAAPVPDAVGSVRVVVTRGAGANIIERHANSTQYLLVLDGPVQTHVLGPAGWRIDDYGYGHSPALEDRWHVVAPDTWHRTVAAGLQHWGIVAMHSAAQVVDEHRPL